MPNFYLPECIPLNFIFRQYVPSQRFLFDRSSIAKLKISHRVNDVNNGSPSRMRSVLRISLGITILPRSSTRRTIPVAFISFLSLCPVSNGIVCRNWRIMRFKSFDSSTQSQSRFPHRIQSQNMHPDHSHGIANSRNLI